MGRSTLAEGREFVLCFDGTSYEFHGDEADSNVLKIYRMLDRNNSDQFHYYQSGFGTSTSTSGKSADGSENRLKRWIAKTKDAAVGATFDEHVIDAYRFLMRFYYPGDRIYIFGFSRGAFVARILAEMLDYMGLLEAGNEGKVRYVWTKFSKWAKCTDMVDADRKKKVESYKFMKAFRETFCRPVSQIRFLGLFDTVNSIPRLEVIRNKFLFPFTARTSAKVIRHAVSIDEHRAKFRQDLLSDTNPNVPSTRRKMKDKSGAHSPQQPHRSEEKLYRPVPSKTSNMSQGGHPGDSLHPEQDIEEVWFAGCHADIGGGLRLDKNEDMALSHVPLVWMVQEAQRAGLRFDHDKMKQFHCYDDTADYNRLEVPFGQSNNDPTKGLSEQETNGGSDFHRALRRATSEGHVHDFLRYSRNIPWPKVASWRLIECLPFRRMGLQPDGSWKPMRWPLPLGERRDIPRGAKIHGSVFCRMKTNADYRPKNMLKEGKGKYRPPLELSIREWEVYACRGCPVREIYHHKRS